MTAAAAAAGDAGAPVRRARIAVTAVFVLFGVNVGTWAVHIPLVQAQLAIEPQMLGLALLGSAIGSVVAQPAVGYLMTAVGSRLPTVVILIVSTMLLPLPIISPSVAVPVRRGGSAGRDLGGLNVCMNTQATEVETARAHPDHVDLPRRRQPRHARRRHRRRHSDCTRPRRRPGRGTRLGGRVRRRADRDSLAPAHCARHERAPSAGVRPAQPRRHGARRARLPDRLDRGRDHRLGRTVPCPIQGRRPRSRRRRLRHVLRRHGHAPRLRQSRRHRFLAGARR